MSGILLRTAVVLALYIHNVELSIVVPSDMERSIQPQRGPVCFDCAVMDRPNACPHLTICNIGQVCMLREIRDYSTGSLKYHAACESPLVCAGHGFGTSLIGRRESHGCLTCCYLDYCNDRCTGQSVTQVPTTLSTLPASNGIGIYCYNCAHMDAPDECLTFTLCSQDEVCMLRDLYEASSNRIEYAASCESKQVCAALSSIAPSNRCHECCTKDFCNDKCQAGTLHTTPMSLTTAPTTHAPPKTTTTSTITATTHGRVCYSCNAVEDVTSCMNIAQCQAGQICMLSEQAPDQTGKVTYTASCENKQVCDALSSLHVSSSGQVCHVCCDSDLCNGNCGNQPAETTTRPGTNTPVPQKTPTQAPPIPTTSIAGASPSPNGPLQCYECHNMIAADDCNTKVTCDMDEICMIREFPSPSSGRLEFSASCESSRVCEVMNSLPGKRSTTMCHQCCHTSLCNNACN